jgi:hypothetical protein
MQKGVCSVQSPAEILEKEVKFFRSKIKIVL